MAPKGDDVARRNYSPGYTLVEMLIGMVILLMVIAGALSFFIFQSSEGFESFRLKSADEAVSLAQSVIAQDILEAGFGLTDHPELSLYIIDGTTVTPVATPGRDQFYLSYNRYLTMETTSASLTSPAAEAVKWNTVYFDTVKTSDSSGSGGYQGFFKLTSPTDQFTIRYCPNEANIDYSGMKRPSNVGGVIAVDSTGTTKVGQVLLNNTSTVCVPENAPLQALYQKCTYKLAPAVAPMSAMSVNDIATPAVCYRIIVGADNIGALWRNPGGGAQPVGMPFLGGETFFDVTGFEVDYQFADGAWAKTWNAALSHTPTTLKLVRVRLSYRTRGKESRWSPTHVRTITGSPRNLVLGGS